MCSCVGITGLVSSLGSCFSSSDQTSKKSISNNRCNISCCDGDDTSLAFAPSEKIYSNWREDALHLLTDVSKATNETSLALVSSFSIPQNSDTNKIAKKLGLQNAILLSEQDIEKMATEQVHDIQEACNAMKGISRDALSKVENFITDIQANFAICADLRLEVDTCVAEISNINVPDKPANSLDIADMDDFATLEDLADDILGTSDDEGLDCPDGVAEERSGTETVLDMFKTLTSTPSSTTTPIYVQTPSPGPANTLLIDDNDLNWSCCRNKRADTKIVLTEPRRSLGSRYPERVSLSPNQQVFVFMTTSKQASSNSVISAYPVCHFSIENEGASLLYNTQETHFPYSIYKHAKTMSPDLFTTTQAQIGGWDFCLHVDKDNQKHNLKAATTLLSSLLIDHSINKATDTMLDRREKQTVAPNTERTTSRAVLEGRPYMPSRRPMPSTSV